MARVFHLFTHGERYKKTWTKYPRMHEISDISELVNAISVDNMSAECKDNKRDEDNFIKSDCIFSDFDNDHSDIESEWITPEHIENWFEDVEFYIVPSRNNMKPKDGKPPRPKFHVLFPVDPITDARRVKSLMSAVISYFPGSTDKAVSDAVRFFYAVEDPKPTYHQGKITLADFVIKHPPIDQSEKQNALEALSKEERDFFSDISYGFYEKNLPDILDAIPADDRKTWIEVGMALKAEGFPCRVWDIWSQKSSKYPGVKDIAYRWNGFKGKGIDGTYLLKLAKQYGWKCKYPSKSISDTKASTENSTPQPQGEKARDLEIYWASDLDKEELSPPEFIIPDILPTGLTIFAAPPKTGKSFFMLEAAAAIADGGIFWGKQTKAGTVLYLDIESSKYRVKKRLASMGIQCPKKLGIAHRSEQLDTGLLDQLKSHMEKYPDTVAIIIDTLGRVKGSGRSRADAYTQDTQILAPLQTFALQNNIAVIAVTHLRKDIGYKPGADPFEMITGSNAQFGVSDAGWLITGKRGETEKHFLAVGRDIEQEIDWTIERLSNGGWSLKGETAKLNLEAEYNNYLFAPVTSTIRDLVSVPGSSWSGTAMALSEQISMHTGTNILPADIGMTVKKMAPLLLKYDNILHIPPNPNGGNKGRVHTFRREETI